MSDTATPRSAMAATGLFTKTDTRMLMGQVLLAIAAFGIGIFQGLAQALDRVMPADATIWTMFPGLQNYYQGLTSHAVLLVFVFTFAFSSGFMTLVHQQSLNVKPRTWLLVSSFAAIVIGGVLAAWQIFTNDASVLFTMYAPLQASWIFYVGATLVVISTWLIGLNAMLSYLEWKKANPGERIPLQAFSVLATYAMWFIASLGVAVLVLFMYIPWSMGLVEHTDPQLARTLFWFTGHPIVYFWLLPAYVSWYTMIPKQVGGRIFSDGLVRLVFILFLILSIPTGLHHQYTDPGILSEIKTVHLVMTFGVFFPSVITFFSVMAALESGGRANGGKGLLGWITKLPWGDPSVTAQLLAMIGFILGGISGLVNASYTVNLVIHNTAWIPGHFHLTVGTAVALSLMGISYWMLPHMTGRALWGRRTALAQSWLWLGGVLIFSRGQIMGGLLGLPRRLSVSNLAYDQPEWLTSHQWTAVGGTIMFISGVLFLLVVVMTLVAGERDTMVDMPVGETVVGAAESWPALDRWPVWIGLAVVLILIAYVPVALTYSPNFVVPGITSAFGGG